jgi:Ala-tRNA(Pro) deacylase
MSEALQQSVPGRVTTLEGYWGPWAVVHYLDREGWHHELVLHKPTFRAADEAVASGAEPAFTAKTVVLYGATGFTLAVLPASERLDVHKVRTLLHDPGVRLAGEDEIDPAFPLFDVGAIPPLGCMLNLPQLLDERLLRHSRVVASAGDHSHAVVLLPDELRRRGHSRVADLVQE